MSLKKSAVCECPYCRAEQEITCYSSINVTADPELKEQLMSGTLNGFPCRNCGDVIDIEYSLLYHDMENRLLIHLQLEDKSPEFEPEELSPEWQQEGYILRIVRSYPELVEKILIFDQGLNDLVIHQTVSSLLETLKGVGEEYQFHIFFRQLKTGWFSQKIVFDFFSNPSQVMELFYPVKSLGEQEKVALFDMEGLRGKEWV